MNDGTVKVTIAGKDLNLSPLTLGGFRRQRDRLVLLNSMKDRDRATLAGQLPTAAEVEAMLYVVGDSAGLIVGPKDPKQAEKFAEFEAWASDLEALEFVRGVTELSDAMLSVFKLAKMNKAPENGGAVGTGEAQGS